MTIGAAVVIVLGGSAYLLFGLSVAPSGSPAAESPDHPLGAPPPGSAFPSLSPSVSPSPGTSHPGATSPGTPPGGNGALTATCSTSAALGSCGPYSNYTPITDIASGTSVSIGNNVWDPVSGWSQTLYASSPGNWGVTANMPAGHTTAVSYPSVTADYMQGTSASTPLSDYASIYSSFSETMNANSGTSAWANYNINVGQGSGTSTTANIRIEHDNANFGSCSSQVTATFGGSGGVPVQQWGMCQFGSEFIWQLDGNEQSGSVDVLAMLKWLVSQGYLPQDTGLFQINYGWQIASTGGQAETFQVSSFSISVST